MSKTIKVHEIIVMKVFMIWGPKQGNYNRKYINEFVDHTIHWKSSGGLRKHYPKLEHKFGLISINSILEW